MGKACRNRHAERQDFSALLQSMQKEAAARSRPDSDTGITQPAQPPAMSAARQRFMSDQKIRYAVTTCQDGVLHRERQTIHDKSCTVVKSMPDVALGWLPDFDLDMDVCPVCAEKAYIRAGAKDFSRVADYFSLYKAFRFTSDMLRHIYLIDGWVTELVGLDTLKIWCNEDTWLIKQCQGAPHRLALYHNNYRRVKGGAREFEPGFHLQFQSSDRNAILDFISMYSWDGHKSGIAPKKRTTKPNTVKKHTETLAVEANAKDRSLLARLLAWFKRVFV